ncbi:MAG: glycosyltransferase family 2 protein [Anaerolineaceae bacterium]|nr:glycosyltransferase family 2 protein [Anaerolineaceae bacterium]
MPVELSFCIVSYNTLPILRDCLNSLVQNAPAFAYEVVVVDNASRDGTAAMLEQEFPSVRVIQNDTNRGYTAPMNQALRAAGGKRYLVQLNPDTLILPGTFDCLANFMDAHPDIGICIPKVLNRDGTLQKQCRRSEARPWDAISYFLGLNRLFPHSRFFNNYLKGYQNEDKVHEVEAVSGSCMFIRRSVIERIGYLDEGFFSYQEDSDFCFRARQAGWLVYYVPIAQIIHFGGQGGSMVEQERAIRAWHESYIRYYHKHLARDYFFLFNSLFYALIWVKEQAALLAARRSHRDYVGTPKP